MIKENSTKKTIFLILSPVLVLLLGLFAWSVVQTPSLNNKIYVCATYSVPGMHCTDRRGAGLEYEVVEEDEYGRILIKYSAEFMLSQQRETAYVIMQKHDGERVYYYENVNWVIGTEADQTFKENNDWGIPLNEEKMTERKVELGGLSGILKSGSKTCGNLKVGTIEEVFGTVFDDKSFTLEAGDYDYCDTDAADEKDLYVLSKTDKTGKTRHYAFIACNNEILTIGEITDIYDFSQEIADLKAGCGWK